MSKTVEGYLTAVDTKTGQGKRGPWTLYRGQVDGRWHSFGFVKPNVAQGDYIRLTLEAKGDFEEAIGVRKIPAPDAPPPSTAAPSPAFAASAPYKDTRQDSIVYQSSRKDALALVDILIRHDALPVSGAKGAAGKAARFDEIAALVEKLTVQMFYDVNTLRVLKRVQDAGAEVSTFDPLPENQQVRRVLQEDAPDDPTAAAASEDGNW